MTRRTFTRRFQRRTGTSFAKWLVQQRVLRARELLETAARPVEDVALRAGFGTAASPRQHFGAQLATSPAQCRKEFTRRA